MPSIRFLAAYSTISKCLKFTTGLFSTSTASARPLVASRKAVSTSLGAFTSRDLRSIPNAFAASSVALRISALPGSVEVPSVATRVSLGAISFSSSSLLPLSSGERADSPVIWPPGRAQARKDSRGEGVIIDPHHSGNRAGGFLGWVRCSWTGRHDDVHIHPHELLGQPVQAMPTPAGIAPFDLQVLSLHVPKITQTLTKRIDSRRNRRG